LVLNVLAVLALGLAYMSPFVDPNKTSVFSFFGLFYPVILMVNLAMILFWMLVDFKKLFLSLIAVILGWSHLQGFVNFGGNETTPAELKILTYNVGFGYPVRSGRKEMRAKNKEALSSFFLMHDDVDIFCLQESSAYFSRRILREAFPGYHAVEVENQATFLFSKYPIVQYGNVPFGTSTNSCLWADFDLGNDTIRVYNVHLQSNSVSLDANEVIDNVNLQEKKTWQGIRGILGKYSASSKVRARQAQKVKAHALLSEYPTIILGDINDPPTAYSYRKLSNGFQDAFIQAGNGIGTTYAGKIPMLRIDYILVDDHFETKTFTVLEEPYSDHYAVKAGISFK